MADRNQWSGDSAATTRPHELDLDIRRQARRETAFYAEDAAELAMFLSMLGLDNIPDDDIDPTER